VTIVGHDFADAELDSPVSLPPVSRK
jgi:hypothetical protein